MYAVKQIARIGLKKKKIWINSTHAMSKAAELQPQVSFVALSLNKQYEFFLQRVIAASEDLFKP